MENNVEDRMINLNYGKEYECSVTRLLDLRKTYPRMSEPTLWTLGQRCVMSRERSGGRVGENPGFL